MTTKYYTHINRGTIDSNRKHNKNDPPIATKRGKTGKSKMSHTLVFVDKDGNEVARAIYSPHKPILSCGARLVIESEYEPRIIEE